MGRRGLSLASIGTRRSAGAVLQRRLQRWLPAGAVATPAATHQQLEFDPTTFLLSRSLDLQGSLLLDDEDGDCNSGSCHASQALQRAVNEALATASEVVAFTDVGVGSPDIWDKFVVTAVGSPEAYPAVNPLHTAVALACAEVATDHHPSSSTCCAASTGTRVGVLTSSGVRETGLWQDALEAAGATALLPPSILQSEVHGALAALEEEEEEEEKQQQQQQEEDPHLLIADMVTMLVDGGGAQAVIVDCERYSASWTRRSAASGEGGADENDETEGLVAVINPLDSLAQAIAAAYKDRLGEEKQVRHLASTKTELAGGAETRDDDDDDNNKKSPASSL